jgi:prepilin-type N-terminal cleavage/methylation domain-containing protein
MNRGFTLLELLISIILMVILLSAVTMIFMQTTDLVSIQEARTTVYTNSRYALETLENDLMGCFPFGAVAPPGSPPQPERQSFWMENGTIAVASPGSWPNYAGVGDHVTDAADRICFRAMTTVADTMQAVQVIYELIPGDRALAPPANSPLPIASPGGTVAGDSSHRQTVRMNPPRGLYTLIRRVRAANPTNPAIYDQVPKDSTGQLVPDMELCHYVLAFNLEYYSNTRTFSQLQPSFFTSKPAPASDDPLGNGQGPNDQGVVPPDPASGPFRVSAVRVTLRITEDTGERQERVISRVLRIPVG